MKILHINCNYIGTMLHGLMIAGLRRLGHENKVFVPTYDKRRSVVGEDEDVVVCECFRKWDRLLFDYKQSKIQKALQANYNIGEYDLMHAYTLYTDGNCARKMSEKYGVPYVVAVRNTDVNVFMRLMPHLRSRGVKTMRAAKAVFFLSEAYKKQVFEKYVPAKYHEELQKKSYIIPNGIDDFWLKNISETENELQGQIKLLYAGRIDRNKNIPTTQKAMQLLRQKGYDLKFTVVGKVADEAEFATIMANPFTEYISAKPKEELIGIYRQHNIFVMPSFTET